MNDIKKVLIVAICVVLVIAIAAGVSIGVMANTMNGLKDRVEELDQAYASDVAAMKAEIEAAKAANENLVTAADFEAKLAAAIGEQNQTMQSLISTAVKNQIEDLEVEGLTEEQVNEIIDAAVANCLTEADIDAIIADVDTGLTKDEVKKIVANYTAGSLTYAQIVNLIDDADYDLRKFLEDQFTEELNKVIAEVNKLGGDLGKLEQSTSSYVVDTAKKTVTIASAKGLVDWANDTNNGKSWHGYTITLVADIDLAGIVWEPVQIAWEDTIVFDGGNHVVSNLTVESHVAVEDNGYKYVGFFAKVGAITVKNVTFDGADITAPAGEDVYAGVVAAYAYDSVNSNVSSYENIAVINSTVYGEDKCGGLLGFFGEEDFTMENITVTGCTIGSEKADAAGGVVGRVGAIFITVNNFTYDNNTLIAKNDNKGQVDGKNSRTTVESTTDLENALTSGGYVVLDKDIETSEVIEMKNGGTLNGNGCTITSGASNHAVTTTGGTIKNLVVKDAFRGIGTHDKITEDLIVDNYSVDGGTYTLHIGVGNGKNLIVTNSTLNGWTSYGQNFGTVEFTNCEFGKGDSDYYAMLRAYSNTTVTNCSFESKANDSYSNGQYPNFMVETSGAGVTLTLVDCYVGSTLITADNIDDLLTIDGNIVVANTK